MFNIETLQSKSATDLAKITKDLGVKLAKNSTENDKIFAILDFQASNTKVAKDYFNATETPMNTEEKDGRVYSAFIRLTARDRVHLANIMRKIRVMPDVIKVTRNRN